MKEPSPSISASELDVLKVLWDHGPATVREVKDLLHQGGRRWAYTTVLTLLGRLEAKGCVSSDKTGVAHVFRAALSRDRLLRGRLRELADQLCAGTASPLVHALVEGHRFTPEEIDQFRKLLDELETQQEKPKSKRRKRPY
jgi:BlaI family penicillinase repressor